jgi:hypothetical protein
MNKKLLIFVTFSVVIGLSIISFSFLFAQRMERPQRPRPLDSLLIKNYKPKSNLVVPRTEVKGAKFPAIDTHCHGIGGNTTPEGVEEWAKILKEVNVKKSVVFGGTGDRFKKLVEVYKKHLDVFNLWCGLDFTDFDKPGFSDRITKELENCVALGAKGVGEMGDKGSGCWGARKSESGEVIHWGDPRLDKVMAKCAELGIPISLHMGDPAWSYQKIDQFNEGLFPAQTYNTYGTGIPGWEEISKWRDETLRRNPKTIFLLCHLANLEHDLASLGKIFDKYPNAYADISARFRDIARQPRFAKKFFIKYQDRLTYGTDLGVKKDMYIGTFRILQTDDEYFTPVDGSSFLWMVYGLDLPDEVLQKLYSQVAEKIMKQ